MGYSSRNSFPWLRDLLGTVVTETETATYISKKLVFTILAAFLLARAIRRLIDVARRKRAQQIAFATAVAQASDHANENIATLGTRPEEGIEGIEDERHEEATVGSETIVGNNESSQSVQSAQTTDSSSS